jgi:hypothetical protein
MEPATFNDIWDNFLVSKKQLAQQICALLPPGVIPEPDEMENNDPFAIAMCRAHYLRVPHPLPDPTSLDALWHYYKTYYNSVLGSATQLQFAVNYRLTGGSAA